MKETEIIKGIQKNNAKRWREIELRNRFKLFKRAAEKVPAYKDFLKKHRINPAKINSKEDFTQLPVMNKDNYLRKYPLKDLCWDGNLEKSTVFSATSGSTGQPFYFPHGPGLDWEYSILAELFLKHAKPQKKPVLVLVCFGMGVWIGGLFTYQAFQLASTRGHNISILTPGINKEEILNALRDLSPNFEQTVLIGYPPFMKDLLGDAVAARINLKKLNIRLLFAAESFSETFRDYVAETVGTKNLYRDTLNIYGTADIGAMAFETPTSIFIRREILKKESLRKEVFGSVLKVPTLAQYNPHFVSFEEPQDNIVLTGNNTIPLIRYQVGDRGGVIPFDSMISTLGEIKDNLIKSARSSDVPLYELPFVFVYERSDFSVKLYGATIFPEHVRDALQHSSLRKYVTGKFMMQTLIDKNHDQYLEINIELTRSGKKTPTLKARIKKYVVESLLSKNSEYANNHTSLKHRVLPKIVLWQYEDPLYFKPGIKQKWVKKDLQSK